MLGKDLSKVGYIEIELHGNNEDIKKTLLSHVQQTHRGAAYTTEGHESGLKPITYIKGGHQSMFECVHSLSFERLVSLRDPRLASSVGEFSYDMGWGDVKERNHLTYQLPYSWEYYLNNMQHGVSDYEERLTGETKND